MTIEYSTRFIKDLKILKGTPSFAKIKKLVFDVVPALEKLDELHTLLN